MKREKNIKAKYIVVAFSLIEKEGWKEFSLNKLAHVTKKKIDEIKKLFPIESKILEDFTEMIDEQVIKDIDHEELAQNSVKDNLFELIMTRFEKLNPYKGAMKIIFKELQRQPIILKKLTKKICDSMDLFLELSNAKNNYFLDIVKLNVILIIYGYTFKVWLNDDSKDMGKTMVETDKWLSKAENFSEKITTIF